MGGHPKEDASMGEGKGLGEKLKGLAKEAAG